MRVQFPALRHKCAVQPPVQRETQSAAPAAAAAKHALNPDSNGGFGDSEAAAVFYAASQVTKGSLRHRLNSLQIRP
jgi:hypothetical protein